MTVSRRFRILFVVVAVVALGCAARPLWRMWRISQLQSRIEPDQREPQHEQILRAALELVKLKAADRQQVVQGIQSARILRDANATARLIQELDISDPENAIWFADLVDLSFGRLKEPRIGAEVCRQLIASDPGNCNARQMQLFYHAMQLNHPQILELAHDSARSGCATNETYVYYFLSGDLRLTNGVTTCQAWMNRRTDDEGLRVAMAIHLARSLDGSVPSVGEDRAALLRQAQRESREMIADLMTRYPNNQALLAYGLTTAIERSEVDFVTQLLSQAPASADTDNRFWRSRGWLAARSGEWEAALDAYDRALELYPVDRLSRYYRAEALRQLKRLDEAEVEYKLSFDGRALERDLIQQPNVKDVNQELLVRLGDYLSRCGLEDFASGLTSSVNTNE